VYKKGTPQEEAIVSVHEVFFPSPDTEIPDSITETPISASGDSVVEVAGILRMMAKAPDYPLLNWDGFGIGSREPKFAFYCDRCPGEYLAELPILKCPVGHGDDV